MATNQDLSNLINCLNKGKFENNNKIIQINKELSPGVRLMNVKDKNSVGDCPYYFIKEGNIYVGVVQDGGTDLHWYLEEDYRGKDLMYNSLAYYILPDIFRRRCQNEQLITIDEFEVEKNTEKSIRLAKKLGFKQIKEEESIGNRKRYTFKLEKENLFI